MYVYCDVIEPQMIGLNALKLLVPMVAASAQNDGGEGKWELVRTKYVKLSKNYFVTLEIQFASL